MPPRRHLLNPGASTPGIRPVVVRKRPPRPCPCCGQPGGMCAVHLERLARVKAELNQGGMFSQRSDQRRVKRGPTCGAVGCLAPHRRAAGVAMTGVGLSVSPTRKCPWCSELVHVRKDGALAVHRWDVRQGGDDPEWARCVGSGTTDADALAAGWDGRR